MKFYYAHYSRYGVRTTWASDGTITGDVYAFRTRKERESFVETHEWDNYPNWTCRTINRKEVEENLGRHFVIISDASEGGELKVISQKEAGGEYNLNRGYTQYGDEIIYYA